MMIDVVIMMIDIVIMMIDIVIMMMMMTIMIDIVLMIIVIVSLKKVMYCDKYCDDDYDDDCHVDIDCIDHLLTHHVYHLLSCFYEPGNMITPKCFPVTKVVRYRAVEYGVIRGEHDMMKELLKGPITCGIACNPEFSFKYTSGKVQYMRWITSLLSMDHLPFYLSPFPSLLSPHQVSLRTPQGSLILIMTWRWWVGVRRRESSTGTCAIPGERE